MRARLRGRGFADAHQMPKRPLLPRLGSALLVSSPSATASFTDVVLLRSL